MRTIFLGILLLCFGFVFGQTQSGQREVKVYYKYSEPQKWSLPTFVINKTFMTNNIGWINPDDIKEINVLKQTDADRRKESDKIFITLKDSVKLNMISLSDLKKKYVKGTSLYCIYQINESIFTLKAEDCLINENSILSISVDKIKSKDSQTGIEIEIEVLEILTDTKENIEKSKRIMIRGK